MSKAVKTKVSEWHHPTRVKLRKKLIRALGPPTCDADRLLLIMLQCESSQEFQNEIARQVREAKE